MNIKKNLFRLNRNLYILGSGFIALILFLSVVAVVKACYIPQPTPTPSPTDEPSVTPTPTEEPSDTPLPTVEPSTEPSATPEASTPPQWNGNPPDSTRPQGSTDVSCTELKYAPTVTKFNRLSPTDVEVAWTTVDSFVSSYKVSYGLDEQANLWSTVVTGNSTTLHFLPANLSIWIKVAGISPGGCVGNYGLAVDP